MPGTRGVNDIFAIGYADGSFELITKLGKIEKAVADSHKGAVIQFSFLKRSNFLKVTSLKWSNDGQTLATAGEDGSVRVRLTLIYLWF